MLLTSILLTLYMQPYTLIPSLSSPLEGSTYIHTRTYYVTCILTACQLIQTQAKIFSANISRRESACMQPHEKILCISLCTCTAAQLAQAVSTETGRKSSPQGHWAPAWIWGRRSGGGWGGKRPPPADHRSCALQPSPIGQDWLDQMLLDWIKTLLDRINIGNRWRRATDSRHWH